MKKELVTCVISLPGTGVGKSQLSGTGLLLAEKDEAADQTLLFLDPIL